MENIEPTNNYAQRVIRCMVIWGKTSFGTQSKKGAELFELAMTVVASCRLQQRSVIGFMREAIIAHYNKTMPSSLIPASYALKNSKAA